MCLVSDKDGARDGTEKKKKKQKHGNEIEINLTVRKQEPESG